MTPGQIKLARGLMAKLGITEEQKNGLAWSHSNGRTTSLTDMNYQETKSLIDFLNKQAGITQTAREKMIGKICSIARQMHRIKNGKADMEWINNFCLTRTAEKKPFAEFTEQELPGLVTVFKKVLNDFEKAL